MTLDDETKWQTVHNNFYISSDQKTPISEIIIPGSLSKHTIRTYANSLSAKPNWWLAGRLVQLLGIDTSSPDFEASRWTVPLKRRKLIQLPTLTFEYQLKFEPAYWHKDLALVIEVYTG
jgi:hypothetical protein